MIIRGVLAEAAIGTDEFSALLCERLHSSVIPMRRAAETRPERGGGLQADGFGDAMVVLLRKRVIQMERDALAGGIGESGGERQTHVGRRRVVAEGLDSEGDGNQAEGGFLPAHPVRPTVRRITRHPVLERRPEELDVAFISIAQPSADEGGSPREAGEFPDSLDIVGPRITEAGPMLVRIGRMSGEDATRPTVGAADFNQLMGENAGVPAGESVRFRNRRAAGFDGPSFELRRQVEPI